MWLKINRIENTFAGISFCITCLDKRYLIWWLEPIFTTASKKSTQLKNDPKTIILLLLPRLSLNPWYKWYYCRFLRNYLIFINLKKTNTIICRRFFTVRKGSCELSFYMSTRINNSFQLTLTLSANLANCIDENILRWLESKNKVIWCTT